MPLYPRYIGPISCTANAGGEEEIMREMEEEVMVGGERKREREMRSFKFIGRESNS